MPSPRRTHSPRAITSRSAQTASTLSSRRCRKRTRPESSVERAVWGPGDVLHFTADDGAATTLYHVSAHDGDARPEPGIKVRGSTGGPAPRAATVSSLSCSRDGKTWIYLVAQMDYP